jgi:transposase InsO family protein
MPWREVSIMNERREFVRLAMQPGVNRRELCRRFGVHPDTGYKWLSRWAAGEAGLADRSRRPYTSPERTDAALEARILAVRDAHPVWGARKIERCLEREGHSSPAVSTVHEILRRHGRVEKPAGNSGQPYRRFEKPAPNLLWQMDFKGWVALANGVRCHPLTMVDDHSRYSLCIKACANEQSSTVQDHLDATFRRYGLPDAMFVDNGAPWAILPARVGPTRRLAPQARHRPRAQSAVSSAEPRQERALPPHAQGGGVRVQAPSGSGRGPARVR